MLVHIHSRSERSGRLWRKEKEKRKARKDVIIIGEPQWTHRQREEKKAKEQKAKKAKKTKHHLPGYMRMPSEASEATVR